MSNPTGRTTTPPEPKWDKATRWSRYIRAFGFGVQVCMHSEKTKEEIDGYDNMGIPPRIWNTYLIFSDTVRWSKEVDGKTEICEPYAIPSPLVDWLWHKQEFGEGPLSDLGWHCGITMVDYETGKYGQRTITVGDDYNHLWDEGHHSYYDESMMQKNIMDVAHQCYQLIERLKIALPQSAIEEQARIAAKVSQ